MELPYGEQRRLEIARALASAPKPAPARRAVRRDEPAGDARARTLIEHVNRRGVTILLIEHKMSLVMKLSRTVTVLNFGQKIAEGPPSVCPARPAGYRGLPWQRIAVGVRGRRAGLAPGWRGVGGLRHPFARFAALRAAGGTKGSHSARRRPATPVPPARLPALQRCSLPARSPTAVSACSTVGACAERGLCRLARRRCSRSTELHVSYGRHSGVAGCEFGDARRGRWWR
jgi:hypothetical protein